MTQTALLEPATARPRRALDFKVDEALCTSCGRCLQDCGLGLLEGLPPRMGAEAQCLRCQHCLAVCPTGAVSLEGRNPEDSLPLTEGSFPALEPMIHLVRGRRSIRQYEARDVDPGLIQRLLGALAHAPTGVNAQALTFTTVERRATLDRIREQVLSGLVRCAQEGRLPPRYAFLRAAAEAFATDGSDRIFRGAPHLLLVSAPVEAPTAQVDVIIALATFEFLAASAGLGTLWCGVLKTALELAPELKPLLELPGEGVHYYPMLFGYPAVHYARSVQREDAAVIKRLT